MKKDQSQKIIIGIDPGSVIMGYGILSVSGKNAEMLSMGVLKMNKDASPYERLRKIYDGVSALIRRYNPDELAIEAPFYGKNIQSMLKLGRAQGVAIAAALASDIAVHEYAPMEIKRAITGTGKASKEQVASLLQKMLHIPDTSMQIELDATDGLAVAFCHFVQSTSPLQRQKTSSWADFVRKNPDKVHGL
ncbi:crossover junction endodeoxyribonuclease RuvC [Porphyromonas cangingivalis]|uniref:Crossover junction endodeoxyribonuclease RuvC n=1 Tax=Porphyromonas cangingivalis TaxID=36874 RepID=A0A1T4JZY7_PORCN|nr:crossover junction endodeoxyribonuclease RuvC [Porphyromonas cangingivalis]SJZ35694.1 Holliday junction endonuclease RuvC [Porphyromonas cangingivalis]VEJ03282.1 Crossover junction endodeoxyribonuclease RuvC [Porphyromonas cangingivalis]